VRKLSLRFISLRLLNLANLTP